MNPYMVGSAIEYDGRHDFLLYAHDRNEAQDIAWAEIQKRQLPISNVNMRVWELVGRSYDYLLQYADPNFLVNDEAHVVDAVPGCSDCRRWTSGALDANGRCPGCANSLGAALKAGIA